MTANIGAYIAQPCLDCGHTLGNHSEMGVCIACVEKGGSCP